MKVYAISCDGKPAIELDELNKQCKTGIAYE